MLNCFVMSGNGWDLSWNIHSLDDQFCGRPNLPTYIACRICNKVFMGAQALVSHYESHIVEDETDHDHSRPCRPEVVNLSLYQRREVTQFPNPIQPAAGNNHAPPPPPALQQGWRNNVVSRPPPPTSSHMLGARAALSRRVALPVTRKFQHIEHGDASDHQPPSDCTKPYIKLLDQAIRRVVDVEESTSGYGTNCNAPNCNKLDLTLKL